LESEISYNNGDVVSSSNAFGGGDYVVTYQNSIFGVFAVNPVIDSIATQGSSGFDGYGQADTGSLYGAINTGVNIGNFIFNGDMLTISTDDSEDLKIKSPDDLYLDALGDDVHIRADDDVRIKAGYNFDEDSTQSEWRFDTSGYISFPDGSQQSTAYTGNNSSFSGNYYDLTNRPNGNTAVHDLIGGASSGDDGKYLKQTSIGVSEWASIPTDVSELTDTTGLLGGGGTTLPANANGYLVNDGAGNLSWAAGDGTFSGDYNDLTNKPTIPADVSDLTDTTNLLFSGSYNDLSNTPALFDGDYTNLTNTPALFSGSYTDLTSKPTLFDGDYNSLTSKPTIPTDVSDLTDTTSLLSSSGKIGYASGSTVTQTSNRGNGVAINALSGTIVTVNSGMVAGEISAFPVTNNQVDANNDIVLVQVVSPNLGNYNVIANPNSGIGGFYLTLQNISGFPISAEAVTIRFIVIKAPNA
jgi:hypothetical protein